MFVECDVAGKRFRAETDSDGGVSPCQQKDTREKLFLLLKDIAELAFKSSSVQSDASCESVLDLTEASVTNPTKSDDDYYGAKFFVIDIGDGKKDVSRSRVRGVDGVPLTRRLLYHDRWEQAECEYAHSFMCGGFPTKPDPKRPTKDEWLDQEPYEFEVDKFVSEKLFE